MTGLMAIIALAISVAGLVYCRATDAKRRRVFGLAPMPRRWATAGHGAVWLPGITLLAVGDVSTLIVWIGGVSVTGWGIAATTPGLVRATTTRMHEVARGISQRIASCARPPPERPTGCATPHGADRSPPQTKRHALLCWRHVSRSSKPNLRGETPPLER